MLEITMFELAFFTESARYTIFTISLMVSLKERSLVPTCTMNKSGLKSRKVGFRGSYIVFAFVNIMLKSIVLEITTY